ncbi:MAG: hypothetical protein JSS84_01165 [Bacteroidetes bacterium]|nr:hypothetical protein [Bacteroidota bacterium]
MRNPDTNPAPGAAARPAASRTRRMAACIPALALAALALLTATAARAQNGNIAINATGAAADPKGLLDISSVSKGLLIPRMAALPAPAGLPDGLTVFQTGAGPGFRVVQGGVWRPLVYGKNGWDTFGNNLANAAYPNPDYVGTNDNKPFYFATNNTHRMRMDATTGFLGVGYPLLAPASVERLDINGGLGIYYDPPPGVEASNTDAPGVIRYQAFGPITGTAPYRYGSKEKPPTTPDNVATRSSVFGTANFSPLQYAGHWGNIDGKPMAPGYVVATAPPTVYQPKTGGWRALENPYTEVINKTWSHFKEATCQPGVLDAIIPSGVVSPIYSNNTAIGNVPDTDTLLITPYKAHVANVVMSRQQYLYLATELNPEMAQVAGNTTATTGLCPGGNINQVGFYVNGNSLRPLFADQGHVIVRNAPLGLASLNGFDNTPDNTGTMGCGAIPPATWPDLAGPHWQMVTLTTPFKWDGTSNVIVEVAVRVYNTPPKPNPVWVTQLPAGTNGTYSAYYVGVLAATYLITNPYPSPGWACGSSTGPMALNTQLRMPDNNLGMPGGIAPNYKFGASRWRPMIKFRGATMQVDPASPTAGSGNYITYPGALVLEDTTGLGATGVPWGRWRSGFPNPLNNFFSYRGNGTISAQRGVYDNGSRLNDHVFDRAFDGRVAPAEAARYGAQRLLTMDEMAAFTRQHRHLPTMEGRAQWQRSGGFSLGEITNQVWTTAETQALYIADLHDKLNALEVLATNRPLSPAECRAATGQLAAMAAYTDAEKARLIVSLRQRTAAVENTAPKPAPRHGH